jgi:hypothetical protein
LVEIPHDQASWDRWSWHHRQSHDAIIAKLQTMGRPLANYIVEPINWNATELFLQNNSQLHLDMTAALGLQSVDLEDVDLRNQNQLQAWIWLHFQDHRNVEAALGL